MGKLKKCAIIVKRHQQWGTESVAASLVRWELPESKQQKKKTSGGGGIGKTNKQCGLEGGKKANRRQGGRESKQARVGHKQVKRGVSGNPTVD